MKNFIIKYKDKKQKLKVYTATIFTVITHQLSTRPVAFLPKRQIELA